MQATRNPFEVARELIMDLERARLVHRRCACGQRAVRWEHEVRASGETWHGRCAHCGVAPDVAAARARLDGHLARPRH